MKLLFRLSGDYPEIGREELLALGSLKDADYTISEGNLILNEDTAKRIDFSRLSYIKKIIAKNDETKKQRVIWENNEKFEARKAHQRPFLFPSSLHPKLARAMINISGAEKTSTICDPFCGSGGILIEAGLLRYKTIGIDIDKKMVEGCKKNLEHFGLKDCKIKEGDATSEKLQGTIVSDLPYARNTKTIDLGDTTNRFFQNIRWQMKEKKIFKRMVLGFAEFVDYKRIAEDNGFKVVKEFNYYLHKSLSKRIVVVELN